MGFWKRVGQLAMILGPTTVLTGFLFYVGHVSTKAYYSYFGISVSALDVPTSTILLRSVDDLFDPLSTIVLIAFGVFVLHHLFVATVARQRSTTIRKLAILFACATLGLAAIGIGGLTGLTRSLATPWALALSGTRSNIPAG